MALFILLIIPTSFANEDIIINQSQELSIDDASEGVVSELENPIYVNASYENDDGTGTSDSPARTIAQGLNLAKTNQTIYLTGRFSGEGNVNLTFNGNPSEITFIGAKDTVIDGDYVSTFVTINKGTYTFKNITFANHYKSGDDIFGGAISNVKGKVTFENCLFENNSLLGINKANGGAIDNLGELTVMNCTFKNNTANVTNSSGFRKNAADGGAISNLGKLYAYNTLFKENTVLRNGGAIRTQDGAEAYIENCEFDGNTAAYHESGGCYGGAIYSWDGDLDIRSTIFKNNKVEDISGYGAQGGAISYDRSSGKMNIYSCQFINNTVKGVGSANGQSIYIGGTASINYCTIDTSIYSASKDININYNWWVVNDTNVRKMIEMMPSSVKIKNFAELKLDCEGDELVNGQTVPITVRLCWSDDESQDNIGMIPTRTIKLESNCGDLSNVSGKLENGTFNTILYLNSINNPTITANVDNVIVEFDLTKQEDDNRTRISAVCKEISEGENAVIFISSNKDLNGLCLVDVGLYKCYAELVNGKANVTIPNLKAGKHDAQIRYYGNDSINAKTTISVKENSNLNYTKIVVSPDFDFSACDNKAGEKGGFLTFTLTDTNGTTISNKSVQMAFDCAIYNVTTNDEGIGSLQINLATANVYTCAISFKGDESYLASALTVTKLTVSKKKTTITASAKTFKVKTKTKTISVTLKTVKNAIDGKTYLYKGKKVTLTVNGKTYTAKTDAKGIAKFSLKLTKKGKFNAKIKFAGDSTYKASSKSVKITVK